MPDVSNQEKWWNLELECKPDFEMSMKRVYAWYDQEVLDRAPVRFSSHNAEFDGADDANAARWHSLMNRWMDAEYQVEKFIGSLKGRRFLGETFPVFWPNLGPNVYASFYGSALEFGEVTSWCEPCLTDSMDLGRLTLDMGNQYFKKLENLTQYALDRCEGNFMVGYTDLHPGLDCAAAWRDSQNLCLDFHDDPVGLKELIKLAVRDFQMVYDHFDSMLKRKDQLSVTWMNIPSFGKMHIPSCDFSSMISREQFDEFCLPVLTEEVKPMTHSIFHMDGKGVANHIDSILEVPEINAVQWVQGMGPDKPIMQWVPLIRKIQSKGKSVVVDLEINELEDFIAALSPKGIFLCLPSNDDDEKAGILKRLENWK